MIVSRLYTRFKVWKETHFRAVCQQISRQGLGMWLTNLCSVGYTSWAISSLSKYATGLKKSWKKAKIMSGKSSCYVTYAYVRRGTSKTPAEVVIDSEKRSGGSRWSFLQIIVTNVVSFYDCFSVSSYVFTDQDLFPNCRLTKKHISLCPNRLLSSHYKLNSPKHSHLPPTLRFAEAQ